MSAQLQPGTATEGAKRAEYTHDTLSRPCTQCGGPIRAGGSKRKRRHARFCSAICRYAHHNATRSRAVGERHVIVAYRGEYLALTRAQFEEGLRRGRELHDLPQPAGEIVRIGELLQLVGISRTRVYQLMDAGKFPRRIVLGAVGGKYAVGWRAADVERWIEGRRARLARP